MCSQTFVVNAYLSSLHRKKFLLYTEDLLSRSLVGVTAGAFHGAGQTAPWFLPKAAGHEGVFTQSDILGNGGDVMEDARALIGVLRELNGSTDRKVGYFTPALIGLFASPGMFDAFLAGLDETLARGTIDESLRERALNLSRTFIPQVADLNGISELTVPTVTPEQLRAVRADSPQGRKLGVKVILAALIKILDEVSKVG